MLAEYKAAADWLVHFLAACLLFSAAETQVPRARRAAGPNQINGWKYFCSVTVNSRLVSLHQMSPN